MKFYPFLDYGVGAVKELTAWRIGTLQNDDAHRALVAQVVELAIKKAGGVRALAGKLAISHGAVSHWGSGGEPGAVNFAKCIELIEGDLTRALPDFGMAAEAEKWARTRIDTLEKENADLRARLDAVRVAAAPPEAVAPTGKALEAIAKGADFHVTKVLAHPAEIPPAKANDVVAEELVAYRTRRAKKP